jgi:hypothetical protein
LQLFTFLLAHPFFGHPVHNREVLGESGKPKPHGPHFAAQRQEETSDFPFRQAQNFRFDNVLHFSHDRLLEKFFIEPLLNL